MKVLGNILWHVPFLGFITAFLTFILGGILCITVVGAPLGLGLIEHAKFLLAPFSKSMIDKKNLNNEQNKLWKSFGIIVRILYFPLGLLAALMTILQIAGLFVTIVGIPMAVVLAKSLGTFFNPVNKKCVPKAVADELESRKAEAEIEEHLGK